MARRYRSGRPTAPAAHGPFPGTLTALHLDKHSPPAPAEITRAAILQTWTGLALHALDEGVARALADDPGTPQDEAGASYAASFTPEEMWLDWAQPATTLQRRVTALNLFEVQAKAWVDGRAYLLDEARALPEAPSQAPPGTLLARSDQTVTVQTRRGALRAVATAV